MSTDRVTTRLVRSWLEEGVTRLPDRVLDAVLDQVPSTPQRRPFWQAWRFPQMTSPVRYAIAAAAVLVVALIGYQFLPANDSIGNPTTAPSPSPSVLARGSFTSHGVTIEMEAFGDGSNATGFLDATDEGGTWKVQLQCTLRSDGLVFIGGTVTASTLDIFPVGGDTAMIFEPGTPVKALIHVPLDDPPAASCPAFLERIAPLATPGPDDAALEPIDGTLFLRP